MPEDLQSFKEKRIKKITHLYYSNPLIQKAIAEFSQNREVCPRYFEGFGKRPDTLQYPGDVFELVKKGATSFHCSEEIWSDPLRIQTGMPEEKLNEIRIGWDLLIDIDCKWFDYSKLAAQSIINVLKKNNIENIGIKFSGSKGWHILIPWKAFPKEVGGEKMKNLFPEIPRKIVDYLRHEARKEMESILPDDFYNQFKNVKIKKGIRCNYCNEISDEFLFIEFFCPNCKIGESRKIHKGDKEDFYCPTCGKKFVVQEKKNYYECKKCKFNSNDMPEKFSSVIETDLFDLMGLDLVLVSPRHLFRAPYSLHEKTALASIVVTPDEISDFELKDADPMKVNVRNFMPDVREEEAKGLVMQAMDWYREKKISHGETDEKITGKFADFKPIELGDILEEDFPPCIKKILGGLLDGRKRALFVLINFFRSVGMEKDRLEKYIEDWNKKNEVPIKQGYIKSQLLWSYRHKPLMPPNCREFYQGIGICVPDNLCNKIKNPVNYTVKKNFLKKSFKKSDNFKNNT
jgi:hypothetical protein